MAKQPQIDLTQAQAAELLPAQQQAVEQLMVADGAEANNVVGVGAGIKWSDGAPTGKPAVLVLVTHKVDEGELSRGQRVAKTIGGTPTDVVTVGVPMAGGHTQDAGAQTLAKRIRPAQGGYSVGHINITAGTLGTCVYDILPGGSTNPPAHGVGIPPRFYILSNNHVLANVNAARLGDPILQPGPFDGGTDPADRIARLSRFIPIQLAPAIPLPQHNNIVDAAVAEGEFHDLDREIYWIGHTRAWRPKAGVTAGMVVKKTGRTTNFTTGRIVAVNAPIDVGYGGGRVGRFHDQIVTTNMSAGGDSGSLVLTGDNIAVGLLFAGSASAMIANQIENVRSLLRVEVAETIG
jgi:hypothetical protein